MHYSSSQLFIVGDDTTMVMLCFQLLTCSLSLSLFSSLPLPSLSLAFCRCCLKLQWWLPGRLSTDSPTASRPAAALSRPLWPDSILPSTSSIACISSIISDSRSRVNGLGSAPFRDTPTRRIWFNSICCMLLIILFYNDYDSVLDIKNNDILLFC